MHAPTEAVEVAETQVDAARFDFEAVFRTDYDRIVRAIGRVIQDPARAEDLAVEAFWRLWRTPGAQGRPPGRGYTGPPSVSRSTSCVATRVEPATNA